MSTPGFPRRLLTNLGLLLCALLLCAFLLEAGVRFLGAAPQTTYLYQPDPFIGARHVPGARGLWRKKEFTVRLSFNSLGFRDLEHAPAKGAGTCRVAFLGDSCVEAFQVPLEKAFFRLFEESWNAAGRAPRIESLAFGVSGFGTTQEYLAYKRYAAAFSPDLVVLAFLPGNDVRNNVYELEGDDRRPYFRFRGDDLELFWPRGAPPGDKGFVAAWKRLARRLFFPQSLVWLRLKYESWKASAPNGGGVPAIYQIYAERYPPLWEEGWKVTHAAVDLLRRDVESGGGRLLVLILDDGQEQVDGSLQGILEARYPGAAAWDQDGASRRMEDFCRARGIGCLNLVPVFRRDYALTGRRYHFEHDGHWNEEGHRLAAAALADHLAASGGPCPGGG